MRSASPLAAASAAASNASVTPASADTTTIGRVLRCARWTTPATRCNAPASATDVPPNLRTVDSLTDSPLETLFRVGQTPRRALRLTQSIVGKLTDERLSRRETRPLSAGRLRPAAVRAGGTGSGGPVRVKDHARARKLPAGRGRCQAHPVAPVPGASVKTDML